MDLYIGQRIRRRRMMLALRQKTIAERLGLSFQAIQKYEAGAVRVAASTLFRIAETMGVTLDYFVAELPREQRLGPPPSGDVVRSGRRSAATIEEEERTALRANRPLMALPPKLRDEMINHIQGVAQALGKGRDAAGQEPRRDG